MFKVKLKIEEEKDTIKEIKLLEHRKICPRIYWAWQNIIITIIKPTCLRIW